MSVHSEPSNSLLSHYQSNKMVLNCYMHISERTYVCISLVLRSVSAYTMYCIRSGKCYVGRMKKRHSLSWIILDFPRVWMWRFCCLPYEVAAKNVFWLELPMPSGTERELRPRLAGCQLLDLFSLEIHALDYH